MNLHHKRHSQSLMECMALLNDFQYHLLFFLIKFNFFIEFYYLAKFSTILRKYFSYLFKAVTFVGITLGNHHLLIHSLHDY
jgi:hypothetical protein